MKKIELTIEGRENYFFQEAFKTLRTNLQFCGQSVRVISLTSTEPNEGKSLVSLSVAASFAELKKKVLLIDADMRKSAMLGRANLTGKHVSGLSEYLSGLRSLEDCILETQYPDFHIMIAGQYPPNPSELLNSPPFEELIHELRDQYDYIIIDTPPLGAVIDAAIVSSYCDGTVLVIGDAQISRRVIKGVVDQLEKSDARLLGVIRNQAKKSQRAFFAKDRYGGYGKRNGKYKYKYRYKY